MAKRIAYVVVFLPILLILVADAVSTLAAEPRIALFESSTLACFRIPAVSSDGRGTIIVAAEQRFSNRRTTFEDYQASADSARRDVRIRCSDSGFINIVARRSSDGGQTWQPMQLVVDYRSFLTNGHRVALAGNPTLVWVPQRQRFLLVFAMTRSRGSNNSAPCVHENTGDHPRCQDLPADHGIWMTESEDGGNTWSAPRPITSRLDSEIILRRPGPGHGILLPSQRIVVPAHPNLLLSDDAGISWRYGAVAPGSETAITLLDNGSVWASIRARPTVGSRLGAEGGRPIVRLRAYSNDGGETYSQVIPDERFPLPEVHAALLRAVGAQPSAANIIFSFPSPRRIAIPRDLAADRRRLLVAVGNGMGSSFRARFADEGPAGYSDLVALGQKKVAVVYEGLDGPGQANDERAYNANIIWKMIDLSDYEPCERQNGCFALEPPLPADLYD